MEAASLAFHLFFATFIDFLSQHHQFSDFLRAIQVGPVVLLTSLVDTNDNRKTAYKIWGLISCEYHFLDLLSPE